MWFALEVDMSKDLDDWLRLPAGQRRFYEYVLGFFLIADEKVIDNLLDNFMLEIGQRELKSFYISQMFQEDVHTEAYSIQVETLITGERREVVFDAIETMPVIKKMSSWIEKWMDPRKYSFAERLVGFAVVEGILFQGHFISIQLLKERNILNGLVTYNEFISRDEGNHCTFACYLLRERIVNRPGPALVHDVIDSAVRLVDDFMIEALTAAWECQVESDKENGGGCLSLSNVVPCVNTDLMQKYIRYFANTICDYMGYGQLYEKAENPYPEAHKLYLNEVQKNNFFEHRGTQYRMPTAPRSMQFAVEDLSLLSPTQI